MYQARFSLPILFILISAYASILIANPDDINILSPSQLQNLLQEADVFEQAGNFSQALNSYQLALRIAQIDNNKRIECNVLIKLGIMTWNLGRMGESQEYNQSAKSIASASSILDLINLAEKSLRIHKLYNEAKEYREDIGDYEKSIELFNHAIKISREIHSPHHEVKLLRQLSFVYEYQNNYREYFKANEEALSIARTIKHKREIMLCLNNIGIYLNQIQSYAEALITFEEASVIAKEINRRNTESDLKNNISIIYKNLGEFDKALDYLNDVIAIDRELGDKIRISKAFNNLGETNRQRGLATENSSDLKEALIHFDKALLLLRSIKENRYREEIKETEVRILNNIGTVYADLGETNDSIAYFNQGLKLAEEIQDVESMGMINNNIGIVHYNLGNYNESTRYFQKAIDLALKIEDKKTLWEAYLELARTYVKQNKFEEALHCFEESILIIENIRSNIYLEDLKASYLGTDKRLESYQELIGLLVTLHMKNSDMGYDSQAFTYLEKAKARAFLDQLESSQISLSGNVDFKLHNQQKAIEKEIAELLKDIYAAESTVESAKRLESILNQKETELENIKREIKSKNPLYANIFNPEIIDLKTVQKRLCDSKTAFLEYSIGKERSFAFLITKNELVILELPPRKHINTLVANYLQIISDKNQNDFSLGNDLYAMLIPEFTKDIKNIFIVTDDILNFFPFETLISDPSEKRWLIEDLKIAYAPSITALSELIGRKSKKMNKRSFDFLAFGDPYYGEDEQSTGPNNNGNANGNKNRFSRLEYSNSEIQTIGSIFRASRIDTFTREDASESELKNKDLEKYKIIHFAAHSIIDNLRPAHSHIALAQLQNQQEDGLLFMREVYDLKLDADIVTLSACETGLGKMIRGEGIQGLNRAFFFAGASSVLMSLWPVNDQATSQLMSRFYHYLNNSKSIMNSLREAKLELINSNVLGHPFYWAGFIVSGKADKKVFSNINRTILIVFLLLIIIAFLVFLPKLLSQKLSTY